MSAKQWYSHHGFIDGHSKQKYTDCFYETVFISNEALQISAKEMYREHVIRSEGGPHLAYHSKHFPSTGDPLNPIGVKEYMTVCSY